MQPERIIKISSPIGDVGIPEQISKRYIEQAYSIAELYTSSVEFAAKLSVVARAGCGAATARYVKLKLCEAALRPVFVIATVYLPVL
jgi:hypothetical protein